jgi:hypothetical protein
LAWGISISLPCKTNPLGDWEQRLMGCCSTFPGPLSWSYHGCGDDGSGIRCQGEERAKHGGCQKDADRGLEGTHYEGSTRVEVGAWLEEVNRELTLAFRLHGPAYGSPSEYLPVSYLSKNQGGSSTQVYPTGHCGVSAVGTQAGRTYSLRKQKAWLLT